MVEMGFESKSSDQKSMDLFTNLSLSKTGGSNKIFFKNITTKKLKSLHEKDTTANYLLKSYGA